MSRIQSAPPETHQPVVILSANTHYGRALRDPVLLGPDVYGNRPSIVALQEIWPDAVRPSRRMVHGRAAAAQILKAAGFSAYFPDRSLDLAFAVPEEHPEPSRLTEYFFRSRMLRVIKALGKRSLKCDAGLYCACFEPPDSGWSVDVLQAHTIPPIPRKLTRVEERHTLAVTEAHYSQPELGARTVRVVTGDFNTAPNPRELYERFARLGYHALIPLGTPTCLSDQDHPILTRLIGGNPHLDIAMLAVPRGFVVVNCDEADPSTLTRNQIGHITTLVVTESDHLAVRTTLFMPRLDEAERVPCCGRSVSSQGLQG